MSNKYNNIYQLLDAQNNKDAIRQCNLILKKKPDDAYAKLLKAIALQRTGENEEAIKLADEVALIPHSEDFILNNLSYFFKSVRQLEKMSKVYELALSKNPKNESIAEGLFLSYVKVNSLKAQQSASISLNKSFPDQMHSIWYLMTILSLYRADPTNKLYEQLSLKTAEKYCIEGKFKTAEDLYVYEEILDLQGKTKEHLDLLLSDTGKVYTVPTEKLKILAALYTALGNHEEAASSYAKVITTYEPDEWSCYMGYFDSTWKLGNVDEKKLIALVKSIQEKLEAEKSRVLRGPYIGEIEIEYRMLKDDSKRAFDALYKLIISYFKRMGNKPVYYYDMKKYIEFIDVQKTAAEKAEFLKGVEELISSEAKDRSSHLSNYYKLHRSLSLQVDLKAEERRALVDKLVAEYKLSKEAQTSAQLSSERLPGDDLVILAYQLLEDLYQASNDSKYLLEALDILEYGYTSSPKNFQFNLIALGIYAFLGDHANAKVHSDELHIKNIQWDTIGYLVLDDAIRNVATGFQALGYFDKSAKFYTENDSTPDYIAGCYQNQNYSKIFELQKFQTKIHNSYQTRAAATERSLNVFFVLRHKTKETPEIDTKHTISQVPESNYETENFDNLTFNFDAQVQDVFDSDRRRAALPNPYKVGTTSLWIFHPAKETRVIDTEYLKLKLKARRQILKALVGVDKIMKHQTKPAQTTAIEEFKPLLEQLQATFSQLLNNKDIKLESSQVESLKDFDDFLSLMSAPIFKLFVEVFEHIKLGNSGNLEEVKSTITLVQSANEKLMNFIQSNLKDPVSIRLISTILEMNTWLLSSLELLFTILPTKKQKKKEESHLVIKSALESLTKSISDKYKDIQTSILASSFEKLSVQSRIPNSKETSYDLNTHLSNLNHNLESMVSQLNKLLNN